MPVMDSKEKNMFMEAIESGKEIRRYVRIQVIGEHGVGKSTLVRRLLGQDIKGDKSTDGIEINNRCQIRKSNGEWIVGKVGTERNEMIRRIRHAVYMKRNPQMADTPLPNDEYLVDTDHVDSEKIETTTEHEVNMKQDIPSTNTQLQTKENTSIVLLKMNRNKNEQGQNPLTENVFESGQKQQIPCSLTEHKQEAEANYYNEKLNGKTHDKTSRQENQTNTFSKIYEETRVSEEMDEIFLEVKKITEKITTEDLIECRLWDFAGEKDYYVTHQTFLTPQAIYLLVANVNDEIKQVDMLEKDTEFDSIAGKI
ncbi:unnamed protein product [Mytilus coruscus]|uniref:Roc domain-containing protein n=1 Tax=Mytilus coruscus TaxID=42192 RepID=A0A6J8ER84_MYTCO|nr:unnamed protein product [Mytilus coruscus]